LGTVFAGTTGSLDVSGSGWDALLGAGFGIILIVLGIFFFWFASSFIKK